MDKLKSIIFTEYRMGIKRRSFLISTLALPIIFAISFLFQINNGIGSISNIPAEADNTIVFVFLMSILLWLFLLLSGTQLFNSIKYEKSNKITEIILSSVKPHIFMFGKIIAVGLIVITQLAIWLMIGFIGVLCFNSAELLAELNSIIPSSEYYIYSIISFILGFILYGSLYSTVGALQDNDNDNQGYMIIVTFILLSSFYGLMYVLEAPQSSLSDILTYVPFTSPIVLPLRIAFGISWWNILLSYLILGLTSLFSVWCTGKIYASGLLLKGKKVSISDIITLIKQ